MLTPVPVQSRLLSVLSVLVLAATVSLSCTQQKKQYDYSIFAFGTLIEVSLFDVTGSQAKNAFAQLQQDFDRFHRDWSPWTDGDLARLNRRLQTQLNQPLAVPEHLLPIIKASFELSEKTGNLYNPAIGRLINLWQFHKYQEQDIRPPAPEKIQALVAKNPKMSDMTLDKSNRLINTNPAVSLNFGAFAKGYAISLEIRKLQQLGIQNAVINAGGDLSVIGRHGERAWNIGIRHPRRGNSPDGLLASVQVKDNESVFTSGDYERFYVFQNKRYHHILDPRSGYPAQDAQSVTVIHNDAGLADAAATALFVAGSKGWREIAEKMSLRYVMLVDAQGNIHLTKAMKDRIKLLEKPSTLHIIQTEEL